MPLKILMNRLRGTMENRKERLLLFMQEKSYKPLMLSELYVVLDVPTEDRPLFLQILEELLTEGKVIKTKRGRYGCPEKMNLITGTLRCSERGFAFLIPDDSTQEDIFIPNEALHGGMDGDKVMVRILKSGESDKKAEGDVSKIIKRAHANLVGTFEKSKNFAFVVPDNRKIHGDIYIAKENTFGAKTGQKVVVSLTKWPQDRRNAEGKVTEIIGFRGEPGTDIQSIIKSFELQESFPEKVLAQTADIQEKLSPEDYKNRSDLRDLKMVTIDGSDAKDLDDAVSIEPIPDGYRLGVHIADVAQYVSVNSPLDQEAQKRGTSVYLVDRVIPMLPPKLSNGICSLNPKVERLALSVFMHIDSSGKLIHYEFVESVIKVSERMTYEDVFQILACDNQPLRERYEDMIPFLEQLQELAILLKQKRKSRGAIDFDFVEAKVLLDKRGNPTAIEKRQMTIANQIIEECMLMCNETVAEHFYWANMPFVYRIHEEPDSEKMEHFVEFAFHLGYVLKGRNPHPKALQQMLENVKGNKEERILSTVLLRSLKKARYSSTQTDHFGLAAKHYSHFTSPIRRYPDLQNHRIMKAFIRGNWSVRQQEQLEEILPDICLLCSKKEREAEEAERQTVDLKKIQFMKQFEGEHFTGIISNITHFGMFVELENTVEGLIRLGSMEDDYYLYNEKHHLLVGERTKRTFKIGDAIEILVQRVDVREKQIDFVLSP